MRTLLVIAAVTALAACGQTTTVTPEEPVVEAPAPVEPMTVAPLTEADARIRAETAGYSNITGLTQNPDGSWTATGTSNGATTSITITDAGVTATTTPAP